VSPFGQFLLNLLMKLDIAAQAFDLYFLLVIALYERFSLGALVLKLGCELVVLQNSESRGRLQLLVVQGHQVGLRLFDLVIHFLLDLLNGLDLVTLAIVHLDHALLLLLLHFDLELAHLGVQVFLFLRSLLQTVDSLVVAHDFLLLRHYQAFEVVLSVQNQLTLHLALLSSRLLSLPNETLEFANLVLLPTERSLVPLVLIHLLRQTVTKTAFE
jgi:hypothetical protein